MPETSQRVPIPEVTKGGVGTGVRLNIEFRYYQGKDGGRDFGTFTGSDQDGPWALNFEGSGELLQTFAAIVRSSEKAARQARRDATRR
jgi:hypothetical protein